MILNEIAAAQQIGFPILSILLFLPIILLITLSFVRDEAVAYRFGLTGAVLELIFACVLAVRFIPDVADMQFVERGGTLPLLGIGYHLGVDGISVMFVPLTALLTVLAFLYAEPAVKADLRHYLIAILGFEAAMIGVFIALDLMLFWLFFVLELIPSYFLIARWGTGEKRREAALNYVAVMVAGSLLMLWAILLLGQNVQSAGITGETSYDLLTLLTVPVPVELQTLVFFLLFLGLAIKAPIFPFHTWMPRVLEQGPVVGMSIFLVGIKLGTYGFLRFVIPLLPEASKQWFWLMALLGVAGILYGSLIALIQSNLRRLLAFASLSHMGVVVLSLFSLNVAGFQGGLLQMINLGVVGTGLFFVAGFLYTRLGPPELSAMGGLGHYAPVLTFTFLVIGVAGIGLPGTGGFNGEHLVVIGAMQVHWAMALAAGVGTFLTAAYFLWYFQQGFLGPANPQRAIPDIRRRELFIAATLGAMIFWIGLDSGPFLRTMNGSVRALAERVERGSIAQAQHPSAPARSQGEVSR